MPGPGLQTGWAWVPEKTSQSRCHLPCFGLASTACRLWARRLNRAQHSRCCDLGAQPHPAGSRKQRISISHQLTNSLTLEKPHSFSRPVLPQEAGNRRCALRSVAWNSRELETVISEDRASMLWHFKKITQYAPQKEPRVCQSEFVEGCPRRIQSYEVCLDPSGLCLEMQLRR